MKKSKPEESMIKLITIIPVEGTAKSKHGIPSFLLPKKYKRAFNENDKIEIINIGVANHTQSDLMIQIKGGNKKKYLDGWFDIQWFEEINFKIIGETKWN